MWYWTGTRMPSMHFFTRLSERGYFKEEGLDVQIRFPSNASDALSLVAAGKAEIGMYYQHDVIQALPNQKTPVKAIGAIVQSPLCVILSLKDKNITGPEDLAGKRLAMVELPLVKLLLNV